MPEHQKMPSRDQVDPMFDGHLERPLTDFTFEERLDWIWEAMQLLWLGERTREAERERREAEASQEKLPDE